MKHTKYRHFIGKLLSTAAFAVAVSLASHDASAADLRSQYTFKPIKIGGGGWVTGMAIHPYSANVVYCRTDVGGAYRWNNSTRSWKQLITASSMPAALMNLNEGNPGVIRKQAYNVESIGLAPSGSSTIYLAAGDTASGEAGGFLFKSTDYGNTFSLLPLRVFMKGNSAFRTTGERIAVKPNNNDIVLFGTRRDGLQRSTNGGASWTRVTSLPGGVKISGMDVGVCAVQFDLGVADRAYASVAGQGIYRSDNAGASWYPILSTTWAEDMQWSNGDLFICSRSQGLGVRKYASATGTWSNITPNGVTGIEDIAVAPWNKNRVYAVTEGVSRSFRSTNGGTSWTELATNNTPTGRTKFQSADFPWAESSTLREFFSVGAIELDPQNSSRLWFAEGMGMWLSENISDTNNAPILNNISSGIEEMVATDIVALPGGKTIKTTWDRIGFTHTNPDVSPSDQLGLSNAFSSGWSVATTPAWSGYAVANVVNHLNRDRNYTGRTYDGGVNWYPFSSIVNGFNNPVALRFGEIVVSATSLDNLVWHPRNDNDAVYYTTNGGSTWNLSSLVVNDWDSFFFGDRRRLAVDGSVGGRFYFYTWNDGVLRRSDNQGASFYDGGGRLPTTTYWSKLEGVFGKAGHLWFTTGWDHYNPSQSGLYRSTNSGGLFTKLPNVQDAWAIGFGKAASGATYPTIFLYGRINNQWGLYRSTNEGSTWDLCADYPLGLFDRVTVVTGDPDVFGKVYLGWAGNSFGYGTFN